jgi:hypothetical protein
MTSLPPHRSVQGRRPSVGPTTARRRPSVRRRPGAGFLPAWRPAARVGIPGGPFRVYAEDEYFALSGETADVARDRSARPVESSVFSADDVAAGGIHGSRIAAGTLLIAGVGALGVVLALCAFATSTHVRRKSALRAARANARTGGAAMALTATRTKRVLPKTISGRARRTRPAAGVARHALAAGRSVSARRRSNARSWKATTRGATADLALASNETTAGASVLPSGRGSSEGPYGPRTEIAASSDKPARPAGEFGFER